MVVRLARVATAALALAAVFAGFARADDPQPFGTKGVDYGSPIAVAVDAAGNVYVNDDGGFGFPNVVRKFSPAGALLAAWGSHGFGGGGTFVDASGIAVDNVFGRVYVADVHTNVGFGNDGNRVQVFDVNGAFLSEFGSSGTGNGQFPWQRRPVGVAVDAAGAVYVPSTSGDGTFSGYVQKFTSAGAYVLRFGGGAGMDRPAGVASAGSNVYVADSVGRRIHRFDLSGSPIGSWSTGSGSPWLIGTDSSGNLYVPYLNNGLIDKFSPTGVLLETLSGIPGQPTSVAPDAAGNVYVTVNVILAGNIPAGSAVYRYAETTPPVTTMTTTPPPPAAGWNGDDVSVQLDATDGTAVESITYSLSGAQTAPATTVPGSSATFAVTATGETTVTFAARDVNGNVEAVKTRTVRIDRSPPTVAATVSPAPNAAGWNRSAATVQITATDAQSGVASIVYSATGAQAIPSTTVSGATAPVQITAPGTTTVTFRAFDAVGNESAAGVQVVNIDTVAPVSSAVAQPPPNAAGWNAASVSLSYTATDPPPEASGIATFTTGPATVTAEGTTTITYFATDNAGNVEATKTLVVKIDLTPPTLTVPGDFEVNSDTTGVKKVTYTTSATDNNAPPPTVSCTKASGFAFPIGDTTVSCTATDVAGNTTTKTFHVVVLDARAIKGSLRCDGVYGTASVKLDVIVKRGDVCILLGTHVGRDLRVEAGGAIAGFGATVKGLAKLDSPAWFKFYDTVFSNALSVTGASGLPPSGRRIPTPPTLPTAPVCGGRIGNALQLTGNTVPISIATTPDCSTAGLSIGNAVQLTGNRDAVTMTQLTVGNAVQLTGNTGGVTLRKSKGRVLQCTGNNPVPAGGSNTFKLRQGACGTA